MHIEQEIDKNNKVSEITLKFKDGNLKNKRWRSFDKTKMVLFKYLSQELEFFQKK